MNKQEITPREALLRLGTSTAEVVAGVLETFLPDGVTHDEVSILADAATAFAELPFGAIAASVSYVEGIAGATILGDGQVALILDVAELIQKARSANRLQAEFVA